MAKKSTSDSKLVQLKGNTRFGQIVRRTGKVYTIWDLENSIGLTFYDSKAVKIGEYDQTYNIGDLVIFRDEDNEISFVRTAIDAAELPIGIEPLISVPTITSPPDPTADQGALGTMLPRKKAARS